MSRERSIQRINIEAAVIYALKNIHPTKLREQEIKELMPAIKRIAHQATHEKIQPNGELILNDKNNLLTLSIDYIDWNNDDGWPQLSPSVVSALRVARIYTLGALVGHIKNFNRNKPRRSASWAVEGLGRKAMNEIYHMLEVLKIDISE